MRLAPPIRVALLEGGREEMAALQRVHEACPGYFERVSGGPPGPAEAQSLHSTSPDGVSRRAANV